MKNNHLYWWISGIALVATASTILVANATESSKNLMTAQNAYAIPAGAYVHFAGVDPTSSEKGIREYWTDCNGDIKFEAPAGKTIINRPLTDDQKNYIFEHPDSRILPSFNELDNMYNHNSVFPQSFEISRSGVSSAISTYEKYSDSAKSSYSNGYKLDILSCYKEVSIPDLSNVINYGAFNIVSLSQSDDSEINGVKVYQTKSNHADEALQLNVTNQFRNITSPQVMIWVKGYSGNLQLKCKETNVGDFVLNFEKNSLLSQGFSNWSAYVLSESDTTTLKNRDSSTQASIFMDTSDFGFAPLYTGFFGVDYSEGLEVAASYENFYSHYAGANNRYYDGTLTDFPMFSTSSGVEHKGYNLTTKFSNDYWDVDLRFTGASTWDVHRKSIHPYVLIYVGESMNINRATSLLYGDNYQFSDSGLTPSGMALSAGWNVVKLNETIIQNSMRRANSSILQGFRVCFQTFSNPTISFYVSPIFSAKRNTAHDPVDIFSYTSQSVDADYLRVKAGSQDRPSVSSIDNGNGYTATFNNNYDHNGDTSIPHHEALIGLIGKANAAPEGITSAFAYIYVSRGCHISNFSESGSDYKAIFAQSNQRYNLLDSSEKYLGGGEWSKIEFDVNTVSQFISHVTNGSSYVKYHFDFIEGTDLSSTPVKIVISPLYVTY